MPNFSEEERQQYISGLLEGFYKRAKEKPGKQIIGLKILLSLTKDSSSFVEKKRDSTPSQRQVWQLQRLWNVGVDK